jgi:hypothetical protein
MQALSKNGQVKKALAYASGTADRTGAIIDMSGYDGILMIVNVIAVGTGATYSIKAQEDDAVGGGTMADLIGTGIVIADSDDDQVFYIDIYKPLKRYIRLYVDKDASNTCSEAASYILYGAHVAPTAGNVTDEVTGELHISPVAGTA